MTLRQRAVKMFEERTTHANMQDEEATLRERAVEIEERFTRAIMLMQDEKATFRQRAVEMFEGRITHAIMQDEEAITLPLDAARVILACAWDGARKGQGKKRPAMKQLDKIAQRAIVQLARQEKEEILRKGEARSKDAAEALAAERAREELHRRTGLNLAASTIRRKMQSPDT
jgi:hypothetical protein